jgi:hypothetical protein
MAKLVGLPSQGIEIGKKSVAKQKKLPDDREIRLPEYPRFTGRGEYSRMSPEKREKGR